MTKRTLQKIDKREYFYWMQTERQGSLTKETFAKEFTTFTDPP